MSAKMAINDDDIAFAEKALGLKPFDEQRRRVLKCTTSVDVQACPGSGKTTVVIAKLAMLARKWSLRHRGICVLSHTNAAREEIQSRLRGTGASAILGYPHFVGTIQSFVDQFLGTAAAIAKFGKRPAIIDSERAASIAVRLLKNPSYSTAVAWLSRRHDRDDIVGRLRFSSPDLKVVSDGGDLTGENTRSYQDLIRLKETLAQRGVYGYADMFALAEWLRAQYPRVAAVLAQRFPFVLIDEMQDTNEAQWTLLAAVFNGRSMTQRYGDANQAIFTGFGVESTVVGFPGPSALPMDNSYRFSNRIADTVRNVCPYPHAVLHGNADRLDHRPLLILFAADKVQQVIPFFAGQVLAKLGPDVVNDAHHVRVVGAIAKRGAKPFCLSDYWPSFDAAFQQINRRMASLNAYVASAKRELNRTKSLGNASSVLLQGMTEVLRLQGVTRSDGVAYSARSILEELRHRSSTAYKKAQALLLKTCIQLGRLEPGDLSTVPASIRDVLSPFITDSWSEEAVAFLDSAVDSQASAPVADEPANPGGDANVYVHKNGGISLPVRISTIHAAKGQTHLATLLVETFRLKPDLPRLIPYFLGVDPRGIAGEDLRRLKLAYVGVTRPKSLLAVAIDIAGISDEQRRAFEQAGWEIEELR